MDENQTIINLEDFFNSIDYQNTAENKIIAHKLFEVLKIDPEETNYIQINCSLVELVMLVIDYRLRK